MIDKYTPKDSGSLGYRYRFIMPPKVLSTIAAKSHAPPVARKPGVDLGGTSVGHCTRAVSKGEKITFNSRWVDKEMSIGSAYTKESIRIGDKSPTAKALVDLGSVATDSFQGESKAEHSGFHSKEG
jgi:hypothetical protein